MFTVSIVRYEERTVVPVIRGHFHKTTNIEKHTLYTTAILKNKASGNFFSKLECGSFETRLLSNIALL